MRLSGGSIPSKAVCKAVTNFGSPERYNDMTNELQQFVTAETLTDANFESLYDVISKERMDTYLVAAGYDKPRAARLYIWNALIGEAFHIPIQAVEVALRNRINHALIARYGNEWWDHGRFQNVIDIDRKSDLELVRRRIRNRKLPLGNGQIVAGLSFGFWVGMLQKRYNPDLWSSHLQTSFPHLPPDRSRKSLADEVAKIATLRNRISHHEPLINRNLSDDHSRITRTLGWLCPVKQAWVAPYSRVPALLRQKP